MNLRREIQSYFVLAAFLGTLAGFVCSTQPSAAEQPSQNTLNGLKNLLGQPLVQPPKLSAQAQPIVPPVPPVPYESPSETFSSPAATGPFATDPPINDQQPAQVAPGQLNPDSPFYPGNPNVQNGAMSPGVCPNSCPCPPSYSCQQFSLTHREAAARSLCGDVYAPGTWRPLDFDDFFEDGWDEAWASGPAGGDGLTPRHGWLGANDGVFYRLWLNTFSYLNNAPIGNGLTANSYASTFSIFLPLNRRMEILIDTPYLISGSTSSLVGGIPTSNVNTQFGDVVVTPRFLLQESARVSQVFALGVETPTGQNILPAGGHTSLTPRYEFWTNPVGGWVARGGLGVFVPFDERRTSTSCVGNFAVGRYLTSHDAPLGDLVLYGATNFVSSFDSSGASTVSIGPGTRFHVGHNWFVLGFANFYLSSPQPGNYLTQVALMKVF